MWKPIFRHDKGLIEKIAIYTLIRKSNAITLALAASVTSELKYGKLREVY